MMVFLIYTVVIAAVSFYVGGAAATDSWKPWRALEELRNSRKRVG